MRTRNIAMLKKHAKTLRHDIVDMIGCKDKKVGHLGGSCSIADITAALYFYKMNHHAEKPDDPHRDRFILSKGHAALAQYAALAESGYFPKEDLATVKRIGSHLQGHPDLRKTCGVEACTGSLGQGLSIGLGIALGLKLDSSPANVYVVMGDGEQSEGQLWEAALCASNYHADNLVGIVDNNKVQATGETNRIFKQSDLVGRWQSFGWEVIQIDGHDMAQICDALDEADRITRKPVLILAETIKGKGVSFAEGKASFHNAALTAEQVRQAHEEIDAME